MKVQCACGAKYDFAISPEMAKGPVKFVCTACGLDATEFVTRLVHQELGQTAAPMAAPGAAPLGVLLDAPAPAAPATPGAPSAAGQNLPPGGRAIRVAVAPRNPRPAPEAAAPPPSPAEEPAEASAAAPEAPVCLKHTEYATEKCYICKKPICPKCMELFGYVCSPLCRAKANSHGIKVPVFEGQRSLVEARLWGKVVRITAVAGVVVLAVVGFWIWYAWLGSLPKPIFSVRFPDVAYSGESVICGKDGGQIVFLHGGTLARHDMKTKQALWSRDLLDHKAIAAEAAKELKEMQEMHARIRDENPEALNYGYSFKIPSLETLTKRLERWRAASLRLYVRGENVWVATSAKVVRYDWASGEPSKEIAFKSQWARVSTVGDELLVEDNFPKTKVMTHVNLNTCDSRVEEIGQPVALAAAGKNAGSTPWARGTEDSATAGLPVGMPGKDMGKPMDPAKVAEQVRHLPLAARLALPAVLAGNMSQERALAEMSSDGQPARQQIAVQSDPGEQVSFLPSKEGYIQVGVRLVEARTASRNAMKAASGKSALDGNVSAGNTMEAASEMLNELQRARGGGTIYENVSRYRVTLRKPEGPVDWSGEVVGPPTMFPLPSINILAAGKTLMVFSKTNKKLWEATLNYSISEDTDELEPGESLYGQGPCVERQGVLYVFDQGVLTTFELATGKVIWRLPSVGIAGLHFDDQGSVYVNSTTAGLDTIKYARQIDLSRNVNDVVLKIDCRTGKILWSAQPGGPVIYVSGKFLYTVRQYQPYIDEDEEDSGMASLGYNDQPFMRLRRLNPRSGTVMWEHFQQRCPLELEFDKNTIRLVFKKEVQVLKFLSF